MMTNNFSTFLQPFHSHRFFKAAMLCTLLFSGSNALAKSDNLTVSKAWVRATVPGQEVSGAFMDLTSKTNARLIKAESPVAEIVEIHSMSMQNGVMNMREIKELDLPAGKTIQLAPGGFHIMLINLSKQLKAGDSIPIKLTIKEAGNTDSVISIDAKVK